MNIKQERARAGHHRKGHFSSQLSAAARAGARGALQGCGSRCPSSLSPRTESGGGGWQHKGYGGFATGDGPSAFHSHLHLCKKNRGRGQRSPERTPRGPQGSTALLPSCWAPSGPARPCHPTAGCPCMRCAPQAVPRPLQISLLSQKTTLVVMTQINSNPLDLSGKRVVLTCHKSPGRQERRLAPAPPRPWPAAYLPLSPGKQVIMSCHRKVTH